MALMWRRMLVVFKRTPTFVGIAHRRRDELSLRLFRLEAIRSRVCVALAKRSNVRVDGMFKTPTSLH
jgi:hypothetical protein